MLGLFALDLFVLGLLAFYLVPAAPRLGDQRHAREHQHNGQRMCPLHHADARQDAHRDGHDGLHVVVDRHHRGAQHLLGLDDEEVAYVGAEEYHIARLQYRSEGQRLAELGIGVGSQQGREEDGCPEEHPFVDGNDAVLPDELVEQRQIESVGELRAQAHQVAADVAHLVAGMGCRRQDEHQRTAASQQHTQHLLARERLLQDERCQNHGEDRHRGGDDARVDGRGVGESHDVAALVEDDAEDGSAGEDEDVLQRHVLALDKQRGQPEQRSTADHTDEYHRRTVEPIGHRILAQRGHQTPDGAGGKHRQMGYKWLSFIHNGCKGTKKLRYIFAERQFLCTFAQR